MTFLTTSINQCPKECRLNVHIFFAIKLIRMNSKKNVCIIKYNTKIQINRYMQRAMLRHLRENMKFNLKDMTLETGTVVL